MHIHSLIYFLAVVDYNSFTEAALEKNISQSSLSKHIKSLEDEFRVPLFDRNTHKVCLTEAGLVFRAYAERLVEDYNQLTNSMEHYSKSNKNSLKIGCVPILHLYGMAEMILAFKRANPHIALQILESQMTQTILDLDRGTVDLAIVRTTAFPKKENFEFFDLTDDELVLVCSPTHRFAARGELSIEEIRGEKLVLLKTGLPDYISGLKKLGYDFELEFEKHSTQFLNYLSLIKYLQEDGGASLLMGAMAELVTRDAAFCTIPFREHPSFPIAIATNKRHTPETMRLFLQHARQFFQTDCGAGS